MTEALFTSLLQELSNSQNSTHLSSNESVDKIKERIVLKVLNKVGLKKNKFVSLCKQGKGDQILALVDQLDDRRSHDFLLLTHHENDNFGYIGYTGSYEGAKKEAFRCLLSSCGMYEGNPTVDDYLIMEYPIYTIGTNSIQIQVLPHASWICSLENEKESEETSDMFSKKNNL